MGPRLQLDDEEIVRKYQEGQSILSMAREFGVARPTIATRLENAGIVPQGSSDAQRESTTKSLDDGAIAQSYLSGESLYSLAKRYGVNYITIRKHLLRFGVKLRPPNEHAENLMAGIQTKAQEYQRWWEENAPVPYGYCWCGCGEKTRLAIASKERSNWVKGEPIRYIYGHRGNGGGRRRRVPDESIPWLVEQWKNGATLREMGEWYGMSESGMSRALRR